MEVIGRDNPYMVQIASAVLGYATNKLAGKDEAAGAAVAQWGTKWNSALENPQLMVTMGLAYIAANSIVHINGTILAVENASGEWVKTAEANAYIHMIEEIRNNPLSTTAEKEWASRLVFGIVVRDRSGEVIYNFPEDPKDFIPEGLIKKANMKNILIPEILICILVIEFQMQSDKRKEKNYAIRYKKNEN